jgi:hypothetical protein
MPCTMPVEFRSLSARVFFEGLQFILSGARTARILPTAGTRPPAFGYLDCFLASCSVAYNILAETRLPSSQQVP